MHIAYSLERRCYGLVLKVRELALVELHSLQQELPGHLGLRQDLRVFCDQSEPRSAMSLATLTVMPKTCGLLKTAVSRVLLPPLESALQLAGPGFKQHEEDQF